jgi:hypothetical protein
MISAMTLQAGSIESRLRSCANKSAGYGLVDASILENSSGGLKRGTCHMICSGIWHRPVILVRDGIINSLLFRYSMLRGTEARANVMGARLRILRLRIQRAPSNLNSVIPSNCATMSTCNNRTGKTSPTTTTNLVN